MGSFGGLEIAIIVLVILLLFGAKKIPELARGMGQGINEFRRASNDIKSEIEKGSRESERKEAESKDAGSSAPEREKTTNDK